MTTYELPFFSYGVRPTWWKLPLVTFLSWGLALVLTFCAACQSAYPLLYMVPLAMMAFFLATTGFSIYKLVTNWRKLHGVDITEMRTFDVVSIAAPFLYTLSWAVAFLITLATFIRYDWPVFAAEVITHYLMA